MQYWHLLKYKDIYFMSARYITYWKENKAEPVSVIHVLNDLVYGFIEYKSFHAENEEKRQFFF